MPLHERWFSVPDFESKLNLLQQRSAKLYGIGEPRVLHLRKDIADALGINQSLLSRWSRQNRIPKMDIVIRLAELFAIEHLWLSKSFEEFKRLCDGEPAAPTWRDLMQLAREDDVGSIRELDAAGPGVRLLHARPSTVYRDLSIPRVHLGATIGVRFKLPRGRGCAPLWAGWHLVLLSQDPSGYYCLLPRFSGRYGFPGGRLRPDAQLSLPPLTVDTPGLCSLILIACRSALPADIRRLLMADDEDEAWRPAIARLASHCTPQVRAGRAGVLRLRYESL